MNGPLTEQIERAKLWLQHGYRPIPCLRHDAPEFVERRDKSGMLVKVKNSPGKQPQGWLWKRKDTAVYGATSDSIEGWRRLRGIGEYPNLGIATGWAIAADVDVYEAALASATEALVCEHLGATPLRRVGREPKALLLYRAATEPLNKAATALFVNDAGHTAQLEIMGHGQQIVAHGLHPCGTPYTWGEGTPDDTALSELPGITAEQVALLIADAESLFGANGYRPKGIEPPREAAAPSPSPKPSRGTADPAGPFRAVNDAAMADLGSWVPQLFGDDARDDRRGGYRVSSAALGRDLEEDISITRDGIVDFGVHDIGDANLGKRTPIDLVMEYGNAADAVAAAKWLAELTGTPFELPHEIDTHWEQGDPHDAGRARGKPNGHDGEPHRNSSKAKEAPPPLAPKSMADLAGLPLPVRRYLWDKWVPCNKPVLVAGKGGIGKTTLLCQFGAARAIGSSFLGLNVQAGTTLALLCEDNWDDAHLMLARLAEFYCRPLTDFRDFHYLATLGDDNALVARLRNGNVVATPLYERYLQMIGDLKADFQFIDNSRHVALINENDGSEVTTAWRLLHALMAPTDGATALLGHTPKNNSAEFSGNASWENFARCRLFLGPVGQDPDAEPVENDPRRVLRRGKSNADGTASLDIVWERGAFRLEHPDVSTHGDHLAREMRRGQACQAFLDALDTLTGQHRGTAHGECARNFAPKVMKAAGLAEGFTAKDLTAAMHDLFRDGRIKANMPLPFRDAYRRAVFGIARC